MPAPPTSKAIRRNTVPAGRGVSLPSHREVFEQAQKREGTGRGKGQPFQLSAKQAEASKEVVAVPFWFIQFQLYLYLILVFPIVTYPLDSL